MAWTENDIKNLKASGKIKDFTVAGKRQVNSREISGKPASFALGRLKSGNMNKTEAAYASHLESLKSKGEVLWYLFEPMNLKLADKCFYRVDFMVMLQSGQIECHEVKGFWTDDALVKIKTAAEKFPFRFIAVRKKKDGWEEREF